MKSRPRIPRTPINDELLGIVRRENESILANATHIKRNEDANRKKVKQGKEQSPAKEELKSQVSSIIIQEEEKASPDNKEESKEEDKEESKDEVPEIKESPPAKANEEQQAPEDPAKQEFLYAFKTRERIVRTPPEQETSHKPSGYAYEQYYKNPI